MNVVIDIGNTRTKVAVFSQNELVKHFTTEQSHELDCISSIKKEFPTADKAILSTVKKIPKQLLDNISTLFNTFIILSEDTILPFDNQYETKDTLGKDRIAAIAGAYNIFPNTTVLVVDLGTAITFDLITNQKQYLGGNISPGLKMRFKALNQFTDNLPLVSKDENSDFLAKNTEKAIASGVQRGIIFEIEGYIEKIKNKYDDLRVILTGGDAIFFDKKIKNTIFVNLNLNLIGLNRILEHNVQQQNI